IGYINQSSQIDGIRLYVKSDRPSIINDEEIFSLNMAEQSEWYKKLNTKMNSRHWVKPGFIVEPDGEGSRFFSYLGIIYRPDALSEPMAVLRIDIDKSKIEELLKRIKFNPETSVLLSDGKNIIYGLKGNGEEFEAGKLAKIRGEQAGKDWSFIKYSNIKYIFRTEMLSANGWHLNVLVPQASVLEKQQALYLTLLIALFGIAAVSYGLAYLTINSNLKRIFILNKEMKRVESGDFSQKIKPVGSDEIGELMRSFKAMTLRMEEMIDEKYRMGKEVKNAELKALQAQINPHFLYNSLDLVNCLAIEHDVPEIADMINSLVEFYKLSLNRGKEIFSLQDEVRHVQAYVRIQNMRFEKKISLDIEEKGWLKEYSILKIILQPLVENSIMHGILEKEDSRGVIKINFVLQGDRIYIIIKDDGVGMSKDKIDNLLKDTNEIKHAGSGYGVKNINERIKLYYGPEFGLEFESKENAGTVVTVSIPAIPYNEN
ncbi:MAG: sensor histidine kinase, partial [Lachnospiraceae bacterium]|nr:sensor histidine kinase [Lachnospiraceae bacterium]